MFAEACSKVLPFTRPLAISTRMQSGDVRTDWATFMFLNSDGWFVTAAHAFDSFLKFQNDQKKAQEINSINASRSDAYGAPSSEIKLDPKFITNHSFWWSRDNLKLRETYVDRQMDIAVGRLDGFDPSWVADYPRFADPAEVRPGTSLCRAGYSFVNVKTQFDPERKAFRIPKIPVDTLMFPSEGMHTRTVSRGFSKKDNIEMRYVETSTPGYRGQSGGPIFDRNGTIHAMQVGTVHLPLDFHPVAEVDGQKVVENQFLNVGLGVHVTTLCEFLDKRNVEYYRNGEDTGYRIVS